MPSGKTERYANVGVAILAKAPLAGFAKTRLIPRLGAEGAAALQRWLLQRTVATALSAGIGPVTLWCAPDYRAPGLRHVPHIRTARAAPAAGGQPWRTDAGGDRRGVPHSTEPW